MKTHRPSDPVPHVCGLAARDTSFVFVGRKVELLLHCDSALLPREVALAGDQEERSEHLLVGRFGIERHRQLVRLPRSREPLLVS